MSDDESLREEVEALRQEVDALHRRLDELEADGDRGSGGRSPGATPDQPRPPDAGEASARADEPRTAAAGPTAEEAATGRDWELAIGVRWLGVAGGLALVVGVVFFVRLAIEMGLLGPLGRVAAGTLGGLLLLVVGRYAAVSRRYVRWGRTASGAGLAVAYFSLYAAYGFESYREAIGTPLWAALAAMTLLVAGTAAVSVRDRAPLVAGEAFLFGYVTAYLSADGATLVLTPVYVLLLAAGLVAIAFLRPWSRVVVASVPATYAVVLLWTVEFSPSEAAVGAVTVAAFLLYLAGSYGLRLHDRVDGHSYRFQLGALTVLNALFAAALLETVLGEAFLEAPLEGAGTVGVAVALAGGYVLTDRGAVLRRYTDAVPRRRDAPAAATAVVLLAAGIGMALETFATTVGALAVVSLAVGVARVEDAPAFRAGAHVVAGGVALKLLVVDAVELPAFDAARPLAALTGRPAAFALAVAVFYALAWLFATRVSLHDAELGRRASVDGLYAATATGLAVVALWLELSGLGVSVAWALFGFALLGVGLAGDVRGVRLLGVGVLGLATAKVFLLDTRDLDTVARTLSFLVLGGVLLAASYGYARSRGDLGLPGED